MEETIFTKIIKGEVPAYKLYEDEKTIAFLDINPTRYGHTLVVSKLQIDQYIDLPHEEYVALWLTVKKVAKKLRDTLGKERVGIVIKGIDVPHTHVHLLPFNAGEHLSKDDASPILSTDEFLELANRLKL